MPRVVWPKDVEWVEQTVLKMHDNPPAESQWRYKVWLPSWQTEWDVYANWEKERFLSMEQSLKKGDILFDIGSENGWQSVIYAKFVGPENMVLIEPANEYWPGIQATWFKNYPDTPPLACYYGLFSSETTSKFTLPKHKFPAEADSTLTDKMSYRYIHEHGSRMAQITIDDYVKKTGIVPDALTMDTEGAELPILLGARQTLKDNDLEVWVSIHPELSHINYNYSPDDLFFFMNECGYTGVFLANDHEEHWHFTKSKGAK